jgi:hypothetical protein
VTNVLTYKHTNGRTKLSKKVFKKQKKEGFMIYLISLLSYSGAFILTHINVYRFCRALFEQNLFLSVAMRAGKVFYFIMGWWP